MRAVSFFIILCFWSFSISSQKWTLADLDDVAELGTRDIKPSIFKLYAMEEQVLKNVLFKAPHESEVSGAFDSRTQIQLPTADGRMYTFAMVTYHLLHPDLQKQYPDIKAFYGICLEDPTMTVVADYSPTYGFRAVVSQPGVGKTYIDHFQRNDLTHRIVYYRKDYQKFSHWKCGVVSEKNDQGDRSRGSRAMLIGDCMFREYRLALACTGEYAAFHGGTVAGALAAMNTTMNRVNGVFAQDIAIRCVIIANNANIIYTNGATDPYTNNNPNNIMLTQNQTTCDGVIGSANYDVGHVFSTGAGGVAGLGVVCSNGSKAYGVTGISSPIGDPFDIDYVAHEMGHQFRANHTQNNDCQRNNGTPTEPSTAMEPGSASSIMGYAGICSPNVQNNSDENFHAVSLGEIKSFLLANGGSCDIPVPGYNNAPPNISAPANNTTYNIPRSTPFALTMTATDPNGNGILYGWDQMNNDVATMPPVATNTVGPMFRFVEPTTNPTRYFPNLTAVLSGATAGAPFGGNNWEVLPSVARTMNFRGVARDITPMSASCNSEVDVIVNTVAGAGPFSITSQNSATTWSQGSSQVVTWDVAGTTTNNINCQQVDLLWTTNNGSSFTTLVNGVYNDGTQNVIVPSANTSTGRVMVKASQNVFFDINNANIIVNTSGSVPTFNLVLSEYYNTVCQGNDKVYTVNVLSYGGFTSPVTLSLSGLPSGMTASFTNNVVTPGSTTQLTLTNTNVSLGNYTLLLNGVSGAISKNMDVTVVSSLASGTPTLSTPANNATNISTSPILTWAGASNALTYQLQISRRSDFNSMVIDISGLTTTTYTLTTPLLGYSEYFWRVRAINSCGTGAWSNPSFKFETESCMEYVSTNVPLAISSSGTPTVNSVLNISDKGTITDLNVLNLTGLHTYINDLRFTLFAPSTTNVIIWNNPCGDHDNFNINFDQASTLGNTWPCPSTNGLTYQPSSPGTLNTFNGQSLKGQWRMQVQDLANDDGGSLQSWKLKTCMTNFCRLKVDSDATKGAGSLFAAISCAAAGDTIRFASNFMNDTIFLGNDFLNINKSIFIEGDISKNIHIFCSSTSPTIVAAAPNTGFGLKIKGLHIHASNATNIGAIQNSGLLNLEDVYVYPNATAPVTVQHNTGATINIAGDCRVLE
jgi:subtilisin-like proprotein convertase family protein